jgi:hypothetical protein
MNASNYAKRPSQPAKILEPQFYSPQQNIKDIRPRYSEIGTESQGLKKIANDSEIEMKKTNIQHSKSTAKTVLKPTIQSPSKQTLRVNMQLFVKKEETFFELT